jgi:AcrR family transcriptional regulator
VSPKVADPHLRTVLVETAARIVATEGRSALSLRRLAGAVGTSTMAVYTHFGSMAELHREVRREGFARLRAHLAAVEPTRNPLSDLGLLGWAYYRSATASPDLYRAMFMDPPADPSEAGVGIDTFEVLVKVVARCVDAGCFPKAPVGDPSDLAVELWALNHGLVSLQLSGLLAAGDALGHLERSAHTLWRGWGANPRAVASAAARTRRRVASFPIAQAASKGSM